MSDARVLYDIGGNELLIICRAVKLASNVAAEFFRNWKVTVKFTAFNRYSCCIHRQYFIYIITTVW